MKIIFSPKLTEIYFTILVLIMALNTLSISSVLYTGGASFRPLNADYSIVVEESKPAYPNLKQINDTYFRQFNILLDNYPYFLIAWFILFPVTFLMTLIGLTVNFKRTKKKSIRILLLTLICLMFSPLIVEIISRGIAPFLMNRELL